MAKFKREYRGGPNRTDHVGRVRISIFLSDPNKLTNALKGNVSRSFSVSEAKVSQVADAIEKILFE